MVPLLGAIAGCHCNVLVEGKVTANFGGWCYCRWHCSVLWLGGRATTNFAGVDAVPLQGANFCFISSSYFQGHQFHPVTQENNNEFCLELLADVTLFSTLITKKLVLAIWGLCRYYFFLVVRFRMSQHATRPQKMEEVYLGHREGQRLNARRLIYHISGSDACS